MDCQQPEYDIRGSRGDWPMVIGRRECARRGRKQPARSANRVLCHSGFVEMIQDLPFGLAKPRSQFAGCFVKTGMAENRSLDFCAMQCTIQPSPPIQIRAIVDEVRNAYRSKKKVS